MGCLGNLIWMVCGGIFTAMGWALAGVLWCISIVGIPLGIQCFKFAGLSLMPFGREVVYGGRAPSVIMNVFWLLLTGGVLALEHLIIGMVQCCTVIGIPFGLQHFKLAKLALLPFGARIV